MNGLAMLGLWAGVALVIALIAGWTSAVTWANANAGLSSWVQAVGSISAIGLAVWVVQRQHRLELHRQALTDWQGRHALLRGALMIMVGVQQVASKVANIARHRVPNAEDLLHLSIELETLLNALSRTDYLRFETHVVIEGLTVTESLGRTLLRRARDAYGPLRHGENEHWSGVVAIANECATGVGIRADLLHAEISEMAPPR